MHAVLVAVAIVLADAVTPVLRRVRCLAHLSLSLHADARLHRFHVLDLRRADLGPRLRGEDAEVLDGIRRRLRVDRGRDLELGLGRGLGRDRRCLIGGEVVLGEEGGVVMEEEEEVVEWTIRLESMGGDLRL